MPFSYKKVDYFKALTHDTFLKVDEKTKALNSNLWISAI